MSAKKKERPEDWAKRERPEDPYIPPADNRADNEIPAQAQKVEAIAATRSPGRLVAPSTAIEQTKEVRTKRGKKGHYKVAQQALQPLSDYPVPPCMYCGLVSGPGDSHGCPGHSNKVQPHDAAAAAWQRKGMASAIENLKGPNQ